MDFTHVIEFSLKPNYEHHSATYTHQAVTKGTAEFPLPLKKKEQNRRKKQSKNLKKMLCF